MHGRPYRKIGQGHPRVKIYTSFMLSSGSEEEDFFFQVFAIYSHGGHLGHVTLTIYMNFHSLFLRKLHIKFGFDWPSGFREEDV